MDEPVDESGGDHGVAQDLAPLLEAAIARDDHRAALVAAGDESEEQVGGLALERQVADLVDDDHVVALDPSELQLELVTVLRLLQARDPLLGGLKQDAVAALAGLQRERDRKMGLTRAGWAEQADVSVLLDPGELSKVVDERPLGGRLHLPVEVLERLQRRKAGGADALPGSGGLAGEDLGLEQGLEEALVGPALFAREPGCLLEALEDARSLQPLEQVGQPVSRLLLAHAQSSA